MKVFEPIDGGELRVLVLDTATRRGTVAAVLGEQLIAEAHHETPMLHAERFFGMVEEVLSRASWSLRDVQLLAVGMGPGSFTGVRVGMAAAKGIGFSASVPMIGVVSLAAMAKAASMQAGACPVVALLDAKKGEVFLSCHGGDGRLLAGPDHIPLERVSHWIGQLELGQRIMVVGEIAGQVGLEGVDWVRGQECDLPGPVSIALLAKEQWSAGGQDQLEGLEPLYVRPPDITQPAQR